MANEVLAQLCPLEAKLLKDPTLKAVLRFRFGGTEFPPLVLFKVFLTRDGSTIIYMSGKKLIRPASEVAPPTQLTPPHHHTATRALVP